MPKNPAKLLESDPDEVVLGLLRSGAGLTARSWRRECLSYTKDYCRAQLRKLRTSLAFNHFLS